MIALDSGDKIQGDATTALEVDYTIHGLDNNALKQLGDGQLPAAKGDLYTADSVDVITGITLVNTGTLHNHVNLYLLPASGTARRLFAKDLLLPPGASLHFDGKVIIVDPGSGYTAENNSYVTTFNNGNLVAGILTVTHDFQHQYVGKPVIIDNNDKVVEADDIDFKSITQLDVDLTSQVANGGGAIVGTWRVIVMDSGTPISRDLIDDAAYDASWASDQIKGASRKRIYTEMQQSLLIRNLKLVVNVAVNKLDVFTRTGGAAPDASNPVVIGIPDGNGIVWRTRAAAYLSGTSQFIMADAANYWSKGSLDAEIKTAYVYAIWDGTGIIWALGGYAGFTRCPASTTATDDDFFLLEDGSTYTKAVTEYCVCVGKIRYQYDIADTPDHTIQATVIDAPQIIWNPKSDYGYQKNLATTVTAGADIASYSAVSIVVKQSGLYVITGKVSGKADVTSENVDAYIKTGSATYASATQRSYGQIVSVVNSTINNHVGAVTLLNVGDTIHLGAAVYGGSTRTLYGDNSAVGFTHLYFHRID